MKLSVFSLLFASLLVTVVSRGERYYRDHRSTDEDIRKKFNDFDIDENGHIDIEEFKTKGTEKWLGTILDTLVKDIYRDENYHLTYEGFKARNIWLLDEMKE